jgi:hypothetical protein
VVAGHGQFVLVIGEKPPAMSISFEPPSSPADSGFVVFFGDVLPGEDAFEEFVEGCSGPVCLHCLVEDDDEQLGRGLDLVRVHGQVDWDIDRGEWFPAEHRDR